MAKISIARALTKQKTLTAKINRLINQLSGNCYATTRSLCPLSNKENVAENHAEAKVAVQAIKNSIEDSLKYYVKLNSAIAKSNLETKIVSAELGEISVADAITIYQKLRNTYEKYALGISMAVTGAQNKADKANKELSNSNLSSGMTADEYSSLEAKPVLFIDTKDIENIVARKEFIISELNLLINESNALTMIEIDEDLD